MEEKKFLNGWRYGFQAGKISSHEEELKWLKKTFKYLREVKTNVAGLSNLQWRINDRIKYLEGKE
jgi:hypothetical protein